MALTPGTRLGPYEITAQIGRGGMGEVYQATDTRLKRAVAIKVLPPEVATDPERLARFQREAEVLASLNYPHIASIHGLEESSGVKALVMELVEGPTLADRITQGAIPLDEALAIAKQIAEALEAAHEQGIIHRDLKPANIKVREDGTVKVLDFGLAKAMEPVSAATRADASQLPTITTPAMTHAGVVLGTAAYMSPEQARGRPVDKRTDIWAFGCVLYEMLTGARPFEGEEIADVLARVLEREVNFGALPPNTPAAVRRLLPRCLQRDRRRRLADISDARLEIEEALTSPATEATSALQRPVALWRRVLPTAGIAMLAAVLAASAAWMFSPSLPRTRARFAVTLPLREQFTATGRHFVAVSPDGSRIVFVANDRLYLRNLDELSASPIRGTEGSPATAARVPFFSPDGQWLGFWHEGQLKRVSLAGGAPIAIATTAAIPWGADWGPGDTILFGQGPAGIWAVSALGGTPELVTKVESGQMAHNPRLLPGGRFVLFSLSDGNTSDGHIVVQSLDDGTRQMVLKGGADARYLPTGHLVYALQGRVFAVPFDPATRTVTGDPVSLVEDVAVSRASGAAQFSVAGDGTLVYVPASSLDGPATRRLVWTDRAGRDTSIPAPARQYASPKLSPDGARVVFYDTDAVGNTDVWTYEFRRGISEKITSDSGRDADAVWSPDGRRLAYYAEPRDGGPGIFVRASDGGGDAERLTTGIHLPHSWSPDGTRLVYVDFGTDSISTLAPTDIGMITLTGATGAKTLVAAPARQAGARISPDGRWLAYESSETGELEVFVRPFPDASAGRWQLSSAGGAKPVWARDGHTLFYHRGQAIMAVAVRGATPAEWGAPVRLFEGTYLFGVGAPTFDTAPDGRFLLLKEGSDHAESPTADTFVIVQNWTSELQRLVPTR